MISAPHTTTGTSDLHDMSLMRVKVNYLAELFRFPIGPIMRFSVFRGPQRNTGMVDAMIAEFDKHNELVLMIPQAGLRWKADFYRVAVGPATPIVAGLP